MPYAVVHVLDRQRARNQSERVVTTEADAEQEEEEALQVPDLERGSLSHANHEEGEDDDDNSLVSMENDTVAVSDNNNNNEETVVDVENNGGESPAASAPVFTRHRMTLAELQEERELFRRRSSLCILFSIFFLFRLWMEAIADQDMGLLILCIVGTSWTARWVNHNREREEELDRMIANYNERQNNNNNRNEPIDMSMLSFQAQLALAIMESQRQMMQGGGYGHSAEQQGAGVTDEAKLTWNRFAYTSDPKTAPAAAASTSSGAYGSVKTLEEDDSEEPHCSICLCEYEGGDLCVKLPCHHIYHDECISSWTRNHTKCPLCNFELESGADTGTLTSNTNGISSIV